MKLNSKPIAIALSAIVLLSLTGSSVAQQEMDKPSKGKTNSRTQQMIDKDNSSSIKNANFCTNLDTLESKILDQVAEREKERIAKKTERKSISMQSRKERTDALIENRTEWEANRKEKYDQLLSEAESDEEKKAILTFKSTIEKAISTRKLSVDSAIKEYRNGVDSLFLKRESALTPVIDKYEAEVKLAFSTAKKSCLSEDTSVTARTELKSSLKLAKTEMQSGLNSSLDSYKSEMESLRQTREASIEEAVTEFKLTMESAKVALKSVVMQRQDETQEVLIEDASVVEY